MSINNIVEALQTPVTQQAYVDLVGLVLRERQVNTANGNVQYNWLGNAITDVSRLLLSDTVKVFGLDGLESSSNWSNSFIGNKGSGFYDSGIIESFNTMPGNVGANVFITNSYKVLIPEKDFAFANSALQNTNSVTYLQDFSTATLANSNVYSNLSIATGLDYALANNYYQYYGFTSNSFISSADVQTIETSLEIAFAASKNIVTILNDGGS